MTITTDVLGYLEEHGTSDTTEISRGTGHSMAQVAQCLCKLTELGEVERMGRVHRPDVSTPVMRWHYLGVHTRHLAEAIPYAEVKARRRQREADVRTLLGERPWQTVRQITEATGLSEDTVRSILYHGDFKSRDAMCTRPGVPHLIPVKIWAVVA